MNIKDLIKDNTVTFLRLRKGIAYYSINYQNARYSFPVCLEDIGDATLESSDKAIFFMRYIRKALAESTLIPE